MSLEEIVMPEICVECGDDFVCEGFVLCSDCLSQIERDEDYDAYSPFLR